MASHRRRHSGEAPDTTPEHPSSAWHGVCHAPCGPGPGFGRNPPDRLLLITAPPGRAGWERGQANDMEPLILPLIIVLALAAAVIGGFILYVSVGYIAVASLKNLR